MNGSETNNSRNIDSRDLPEFAGEVMRERAITAAALAVVAFLTAIDLIEDRAEGAEWLHLFTEGFIVVCASLGAIYLLRKLLGNYRGRTRALHRDVLAARNDAKLWREQAASLMQGLGRAIDEQFDQWKLSTAEKEVGILLLKGLTHKEIAVIRTTTEKTVRQQATSVYSKAALEGRAQLSAFFLEDLLLPMENENQAAARHP